MSLEMINLIKIVEIKILQIKKEVSGLEDIVSYEKNDAGYTNN